MRHLLRHKAFFEVLRNADPKLRKAMIQNAQPDIIHALVELIVNTVKGNVPLTPIQKRKLSKHKRILRRICMHCLKGKKIINGRHKDTRKLVVQSGGILPLFLLPLLALAGKAAIGGAVSAGAAYGTKKIIDAAGG